jgi:hypothetical protein
MTARKKSFIEHVGEIRLAAVNRFLDEYQLTRDEWDAMTWDGWHKLPVFAAMRLTPLGGSIRFMGPQEEIGYMFQTKRDGKIFGVTIEADSRQRWVGRVRTSVDDAAREAITGLIELAYLRATQDSFRSNDAAAL